MLVKETTVFAMMLILTSAIISEVVIMTAASITSDDKVGIMTTVGFQLMLYIWVIQ